MILYALLDHRADDGASAGVVRIPAAAEGAGETMNPPLLELDNVTIRFGGLTAVSELSLAMAAGELVGLIGPNGAGKTTVFNVITGVYQPTSGRIGFDGRPLAGLPPHALAKLGIARTFQNIRLFPR